MTAYRCFLLCLTAQAMIEVKRVKINTTAFNINMKNNICFDDKNFIYINLSFNGDMYVN